MRLLELFLASLPLWLLTSLEFRVGVRKWQNFAVFRRFFAQFLVTWSKLVHSIDFDIVYTLNIYCATIPHS